MTIKAFALSTTFSAAVGAQSAEKALGRTYWLWWKAE